MRQQPAYVYVALSAVLFGLSAPFSKVLVGHLPSVQVAGLLYVGAFGGLAVYDVMRRLAGLGNDAEPPIDRHDLPWLIGSILAGGVVAPIALMIGLTMVSGFTASLFLNLEGLSTALLAWALFKEYVGRRIGLAVLSMTAAGVLLTWDFTLGGFQALGPFVLLVAATGWGLDNNFTRKISGKDPVRIAQLKGLLAGCTSLVISAILGSALGVDQWVALALLTGAISYGASLVLFIKALKGLGAARTATFFSLGPFVGALASIVVLGEWPGWVVLPTLALMVVGVGMVLTEKHIHIHTHGYIVHTHEHSHDDLHHLHEHDPPVMGSHTHEHVHEEMSHSHPHTPDVMHRHRHDEPE